MDDTRVSFIPSPTMSQSSDYDDPQNENCSALKRRIATLEEQNAELRGERSNKWWGTTIVDCCMYLMPLVSLQPWWSLSSFWASYSAACEPKLQSWGSRWRIRPKDHPMRWRRCTTHGRVCMILLWLDSLTWLVKFKGGPYLWFFRAVTTLGPMHPWPHPLPKWWISTQQRLSEGKSYIVLIYRVDDALHSAQ